MDRGNGCAVVLESLVKHGRAKTVADISGHSDAVECSLRDLLRYIGAAEAFCLVTLWYATPLGLDLQIL
jgi:hypothetical protein